MAGVGTGVTKQPLGDKIILEPIFVPGTRPNHDGSHENLFNVFHIDEHYNIMKNSPEKTVHRAPVAALICVYNEEWYSLQRSLESLAAIPDKKGNFDQSIVANAVSMDVAIVIDGVEMLKPCMRDFLHQLFGPNIPVDVDKQGRAIGWQKSELKPTETCVVNKRTHGGHLLSLILKKHNQKKINSHEWGFRAFTHTSKCNYVLTSDCGTLFDPKCVSHLLDFMEANEGCVACTGRQRVMSAQQQADPNQERKNDSLEESMLRRIQQYEFEGEYLASRPTGSMLGFLEVLPGPCAFFRRAEIEGAPLDEYFDMGYKRPQELGLLQSNLKISEDRIPSWSAVWSGRRSQYSAWVDEAVFFCEAELTIKDLLLQRRRWNNGKFSGHVYVLKRLDKLFASHNPLWRKLSCSGMAFIQVAAFLVSYLAVANFGGAFHVSTKYLSDHLGLSSSLPHCMTSIYFTLYILLILCHYKKWEDDQRFCHILWRVAFMVNGLLVCISLASMLLYYIIVANQMLQCYTETYHAVEFEVSQNLNRADIGEHCWTQHPIHGPALLKLIVFTSVAFLPTLNAMLSNYTAVCIISNPINMLVYMLAMPTYTAFFSAYAISRYADLTWGQRPTVDQQCASAPDYMPKCSRCNHPCIQGYSEYCEDHMWLHGKVRICEWATFLLIIVNIGAMAAFLYVSPVILIVVIYVNGAILQTLAMTRTMGKLVMRMCRVVCSATTIPRYVLLTQKDPDLISDSKGLRHTA